MLPGTSGAVHSWSHVSDADTSHSFRISFRRNLLRRTSKDDLTRRLRMYTTLCDDNMYMLCVVRALALVHTVVKAADVSRRGEPTISCA